MRRFLSKYKVFIPHWSIVLVLGCTLLPLGCGQRAVGWIEPKSTASRLVFGVAESKYGRPLSYLQYLDVDPCTLRDRRIGNRAWRIELDRYLPQSPTIFVYGQAPKGYKTTAGPEPLKPGCYEIRASGSYALRFIVFSNGQVAEADVDGRVTKYVQ